MPLLLGQIVYTSFTGIGFRLLASAQVPSDIQQAFIEQVAFRHWDSYNPPESGYRAVYLHQATPEYVLFGWLYNDGEDDMKRTHVPYFHCYYLAEPLHAIQLENIFTCLHKGPATLIDRQNLPTKFETIDLRNFWSYQPARPGVAIALDVRKRSHILLKQGKLLDLFIPVDEQQRVAELNRPDYQQKVDFLMYTHYLAANVETGAAAVSNAAIKAGNIKPNLSDKEKLQQYEQVLVFAIECEYPISDRIRGQLKRLQQDLELTDEDTSLIEACLTLVETGAAPVNNVTAIKAGNIKPNLSDKEKLQQYEQVLVFAIECEYPISDHTRRQLKRLQQDLELTDEDTNLIEACLTLDKDLELSQTRQTKDQPLERFVGVIKNLFIKNEGKY